jgi:hypothetical protein
MIQRNDAILSLVPGSSFHTLEDGTINWVEEPAVIPTEEQIQAEMVRLQTIEDTENQAKEFAKQAAESKLAKLGLTPEYLKMLLG